MSTIRPTVLRLTVLPPVFGPVITSTSKSLPKCTLIGTTAFGSISGCLAFFKYIYPDVLYKGRVASISSPSFPRANITSSSVKISMSARMSSSTSLTSSVRVDSILSISNFSLAESSRSLLFN